MTESVEGIKKTIEKMEKDFQQIDAKFSAKIEEAEKNGTKAAYLEELRGERDRTQNTYVSFINGARERLVKAEEQEKRTNESALLRHQEQENIEKERALRAWKSAGGDPVGFEDAWPNIRRAQLQDEVVKKLSSNKSSGAFVNGL